VKVPDTTVLWHCWPYLPPVIDPNQQVGFLEDALERSPITHLPYSHFPVPRGAFDLNEWASKVGIPKTTNLFICLDATLPYIPRNVKTFARNAFLILGDTHHLPSPISRVRAYLEIEQFDGIIFTNNPRHRHWFDNLKYQVTFYFEPAIWSVEFGMTYSRFDELTTVHNPKYGPPTPAPVGLSKPVFYGQIGDFHPRRQRLMSPLIEKGFVKHISGPGNFIKSSLENASACVNVTLNADLNNRVFEVAASGCPLIVDRLATSNGFGTVLIPEYNAVCFDDYAELEAIIQDRAYLRAISNSVGKRLKRDYQIKWAPARIRERYLSSVKTPENAFNTKFPYTREASTPAVGNLLDRIHFYEQVQELHRQFEKIQIASDLTHLEFIQEDLESLPRVEVCRFEELIFQQTESLPLVAQHLSVNSGLTLHTVNFEGK
jgi:hypothetical protein